MQHFKLKIEELVIKLLSYNLGDKYYSLFLKVTKTNNKQRKQYEH